MRNRGRPVASAVALLVALSALLHSQAPPAGKKILFLTHADAKALDMSFLTPDYPQAWTRTFGRGRTFYTALGHRADIWAHDAVFRAHVTGGIRWALGLEN